MPFLILANPLLIKSRIISATEQNGVFYEQPFANSANVGNLILKSTGSFIGSGTPPTLTITIRKAGGVGVAEFGYSPNGGTTEYGADSDNVFRRVEIVTEGI